MYFTKDDLFHVYNRGNNSQHIFFIRDNYLFFLKKIKDHILPYANVLAWCLMPNHFHLMIEVLQEELSVHSPGDLKSPGEFRSLNDSIAIMLRSYTRAINKQEKRSGALFQEGTKSIFLNSHELSPAYFQTDIGTIANISLNEIEYPNVCFNYIHQNPVKDGLVSKPEDWEFSSFRDYHFNRKDYFVNKESAYKLGLISAI
jgi:putative transposase